MPLTFRVKVRVRGRARGLYSKAKAGRKGYKDSRTGDDRGDSIRCIARGRSKGIVLGRW